MYSLLTAAWYAFTGRFATGAAGAAGEIVFNATVFSLLFSLGVLMWYRRTEKRVPVKELSMKTLNQRLEQIGYQQLASAGAEKHLTRYKPAPPKVPVLAGKIFVQKKASFYLIQGPSKYINRITN